MLSFLVAFVMLDDLTYSTSVIFGVGYDILFGSTHTIRKKKIQNIEFPPNNRCRYEHSECTLKKNRNLTLPCSRYVCNNAVDPFEVPVGYSLSILTTIPTVI